MYGGFLSLREVSELQGNQSTKGARISIVPVNKLKIFMASMAATITVQVLNLAVLFIYLSFVLKIGFSNQLGYILLASFVGTITGVTFGTCLGAILKKKQGIKVGILIGFTMTMSF